MTKAQVAALLLAFTTGAGAGGLSTAALVRETTGAKSYYTRSLRLTQSPVGNPDGGNLIEAVTNTIVTVGLSDGGTSAVEIGDTSCSLTSAQENTVQNLLTVSAACARNAP